MSDFAVTPEMIEAVHEFFYERTLGGEYDVSQCSSRPHLSEFHGVFDVGELIKALAPAILK